MRTTTAPDGVAVRWFLWEGEGVPIVLAHGFVSSTTGNWVNTRVVEVLRRSGRTVVGVDARGHGHSDRPHDPGFYGEATMARDLRAVVDDLSVDAYDLVGYSMGSIVALLAAAEDTRVRRLVAGGVGSGIVECHGMDTRVVGGELLVEALRTDDPASLPPEVTGFRRMADANGSDRRALAAHASVRHAEPIAVEQIGADTLVLVGDTDPLAARPEVLVHAIPHARLERVRGDHMSALKDPRFAEAIAEHVA